MNKDGLSAKWDIIQQYFKNQFTGMSVDSGFSIRHYVKTEDEN